MHQRRGENEGRTRFEDLYRANSRAILGYALRRTQRPEDAADVLSEVMLTAWRRLDVVPQGPDQRYWLLGVARNTLANQTRTAGRVTRLGERLREQFASTAADDVASDHEARAAVRAALDELASDDREILLLTAWEGLSPTEVASVLAIKPAAARTRLHRARARLRHELEGSLESPIEAKLRAKEGQ